MNVNEHTRNWRAECHCPNPLVKYRNGYHCVRCHPDVLAPCPVCHELVTSQDHRHTVAECLAAWS